MTTPEPFTDLPRGQLSRALRQLIKPIRGWMVENKKTRIIIDGLEITATKKQEMPHAV